jgi:hypothetical protein
VQASGHCSTGASAVAAWAAPKSSNSAKLQRGYRPAPAPRRRLHGHAAVKQFRVFIA